MGRPRYGRRLWATGLRSDAAEGEEEVKDENMTKKEKKGKERIGKG